MCDALLDFFIRSDIRHRTQGVVIIPNAVEAHVIYNFESKSFPYVTNESIHSMMPIIMWNLPFHFTPFSHSSPPPLPPTLWRPAGAPPAGAEGLGGVAGSGGGAERGAAQNERGGAHAADAHTPAASRWRRTPRTRKVGGGVVSDKYFSM